MNSGNYQYEDNRAQLQREKLLYRYSRALERGDIDTISFLWQMAEQDSILESMFFEFHQNYNKEGNTVMKTSPIDPRSNQYIVQSQKDPVLPVSSSSKSRSPQRTVSRIAIFAQSLAAVLVVALLIGSFLLILSSHHSRTSSSNPTNGITSTKSVTSSGVVVAATNDGMILAWQSTTGHSLWSYNVQSQGKDKKPCLNLTLTNNRVYCLSDTYLFVLQLNNGHLLWLKNMHFDAYTIVYFDPSPLIIDDNVLFVTGFGNNKLLQTDALRLNDGTLLWQTTGGQTQPAFITAKDGIAYLLGSGGDNATIIRAVHSETGSQIWQYDTHENVVDGVIVANALDLLAVHPPIPNNPSKNPDKTLIALNKENGSHLWSVEKNDPAIEPLSVASNMLIFYDNLHFCALRQSDAHVLWCVNVDSHSGAEDPGYVTSTTVLYTSQDIEKTLSSPTPLPSGNGFTVNTSNSLVIKASSIYDGSEQWSTLQYSDVSNLVLSSSQHILFANGLQHIYAINPQNGQKLWSLALHLQPNTEITNLAVSQ